MSDLLRQSLIYFFLYVTAFQMINTSPKDRKAWIPPQIIFLNGQQVKSGPLCLGAPEGSGGIHI